MVTVGKPYPSVNQKMPNGLWLFYKLPTVPGIRLKHLCLAWDKEGHIFSWFVLLKTHTFFCDARCRTEKTADINGRSKEKYLCWLKCLLEAQVLALEGKQVLAKALWGIIFRKLAKAGSSYNMTLTKLAEGGGISVCSPWTESFASSSGEGRSEALWLLSSGHKSTGARSLSVSHTCSWNPAAKSEEAKGDHARVLPQTAQLRH